MNFGTALEAAKGQQDIRRPAWPPGMLVQLRRGQHHFPDNEPYPQRVRAIVANLYNQTPAGNATLPPGLWLHDAKSAERPWQLWEPKAEDLLAEDWLVLGAG